jgi:NTE family protein
MTLALVLGGGGVAGVAWETGLLAGLRRSGVDLSGADLIVGTSAGAIVGTQVATGVDLDRLYERQRSPFDPAVERAPDVGPLMKAFAARGEGAQLIGGRAAPEVLAWLGSQARSAALDVTEADRLEIIASRLPVRVWPDRPLLITAVDTEDGSLVTWDRSDGVPLPLAVASSCAVPLVFPPVTISGRLYMDGGVRSTTNADLAAGYDRVVIMAPMGAMTGALTAELAELRAAGSRVEAVIPDQSALEAMGVDLLDPSRRPAAAEAGHRQATTAADAMRALLEVAS